jgi:hypothetical protein
MSQQIFNQLNVWLLQAYECFYACFAYGVVPLGSQMSQLQSMKVSRLYLAPLSLTMFHDGKNMLPYCCK